MSSNEAAFNAMVNRILNHLCCSKELAPEYAADIRESPEDAERSGCHQDQDRRNIAGIPASVMEEE